MRDETHDWRGLPVTTSAPRTTAGINAFSEGFLAYEPRSVRVIAAAEADADAPLANAYVAMLHMFIEKRDAADAARPFLARAEAAAHATPRERMVVAAARAWVDGDLARAIAIGEQAACEHPRELALAKVTQYHLFNLGDAPGMLRVAGRLIDANREVPYVHGMLAFAYEQCHLLREAEDAARTAIRLRRSEPWAHHALAHVMLTQGRNDESRAFLEDVKDCWSGLNSFMHTHNWWHLALVQIEQGEAAAVLSYYDQHIWGVWKQYSQDQIGAVSLLARLELAGVDVGDRWQDVADHLVARVDDHVQPFLSMQYLYGMARAGRAEADAMLAAIRETAAAAPPISRMAWAEVCVPACEGLLAHARGDMMGTLRGLAPVLPRMGEIGGSHAQRDLFEQMALDALVRTGRLVAAQQMLELRRAGNPHSVPTLRRLEQVYGALRLPEQAARAWRRGGEASL